MNKINHLWTVLLVVFIGAVSVAQAGNKASLKGLDSQQLPSGQVELALHFNKSISNPTVFTQKNPSRTVFDFQDVMLSMRLRNKSIKLGNIDKLVALEANGKLRLIVHQTEFSGYNVSTKGSDLIIRFDKPASKRSSLVKPALVDKAKTKKSAKPKKPVPKKVAAKKPAPKKVAAKKVKQRKSKAKASKVMIPEVDAPVWNGMVGDSLPEVKPAARSPHPVAVTPKAKAPSVKNYPAPTPRANQSRSLQKVDFRREADGSGKVILSLPRHDTHVEVHHTGSTVRLLIKDVDVPKHLQKRLDVLDFATPVTYIETSQRQLGAKVIIYSKGNVETKTERDGRNYTLIITKKKKVNLTKKKKTFKGDKLSLNFQDIEVRAVLQLLADFTDKNIVVSDSVDGSITVRLKDVPWDQALDIVLETKNLAMRENGNVIWVAPASELAAKEQQELEATKRKNDLEPLITEYIAINFAKAGDLAKLIRESKGDKAHSLLSRRGTVSLDERTNTLLVQDVEHQVDEIKKLVEALDVPVQQVLIESRIVVATDEFTKDLGAKFGMTPVIGHNNGVITGSGTSAATDTIVNSAITNMSTTGNALPVTVPSLADRLSVNLPAAGAAGSLGFAILAKDFLLDLELSALQAESKGEVIATPRVITSNQSTATIEQGVEIPYQQASSSGATNVSFKKAVLSMDVTPQITPDEHVVVDLKIHQDTVGQVFGDIPSINTRAVQTKVLVENGQTIVLGGVHEETNLSSTTKVPVLGDLPVVGRIFRKTHKADNKRELLIFVTPKIIDDF